MIFVNQEKINNGEFRRNLPNILTTFFVIFQILFGYDFGFIKYKSIRHKIIIKLCCAVVPFVSGIALVLLILPDLQIVYAMWYLLFFVEYYSYIVTLLLVPESNTLHTFLCHLRRTIDFELKVDNSSYFLELQMILFCVISMIWTIWLGIIDVQSYSSLYARILYFIIFLPTHVPFVILSFIFLATYIRLTALHKLTNEEARKAQALYKSLIESVENVKKPFNFIVFVTLCANVPSIMATLYEVVRDVHTKGKDGLYDNSWNCVMAAVYLTIFFVPALAAGSLSTAVEKIKIKLQDTLILENDETREQDIRRFLSYIEARPFKLYILRIIPLDVSFVVMVLNFGITYLIVILQLTHIY